VQAGPLTTVHSTRKKMSESARPKTTTEKDSVFRGTWQPTIYKPVFGAYQFLPTPLPQEPKKKKEEERPKEQEVVEEQQQEEESPRKKNRESVDVTEKQRMTGTFSIKLLFSNHHTRLTDVDPQVLPRE